MYSMADSRSRAIMGGAGHELKWNGEPEIFSYTNNSSFKIGEKNPSLGTPWLFTWAAKHEPSLQEKFNNFLQYIMGRMAPVR